MAWGRDFRVDAGARMQRTNDGEDGALVLFLIHSHKTSTVLTSLEIY
jgi:hypothetical protein